MNEETLRFAPAWTDDDWFSKTRSEKLSLLGIKKSPHVITENQSRTSSKCFTFRENDEPASVQQSLEQNPQDCHELNIQDASVGRTDLPAEANQTKPHSKWAQLAADLLNDNVSETAGALSTERTEEVSEVDISSSRWCQLANQLLASSYKGSTDVTGSPLQRLQHQRQQSRTRWTQVSQFYYDVVQVEDDYLLQPELMLNYSSSDVKSNLDNKLTSRDFFKRIYGAKFELKKEFDKINPPVIPHHLLKSEPIIQNGMVSFVLGRGSYGQVIKATLTDGKNYEQKIVVKELFNHKFCRDMIFEEARMLLYLERTGYVPVCLGVVSQGGRGDDVYGILQECVGEGLTLYTYLVRGHGQLVPICLVHIAKQLADGLLVIHNMGILINDIKTDNILLDLTYGIPTVKYCDFGLATYRVGRDYPRTPGAHKFTNLAPEVRYGGRSCFKSDVYSLGDTFTMITHYGQFDALVDVSTKCLVQDIEERTSSEGLAREMSQIYNNHLQLKMLSNGCILTNLEMAAYQLGDMEQRNNVIAYGHIPGFECPSFKSKSTLPVSVKRAVVHVCLTSPEETIRQPQEIYSLINSVSLSCSSMSSGFSVDTSSDDSKSSSYTSDMQANLPSAGTRTFHCACVRCMSGAHNSVFSYDADNELSDIKDSPRVTTHTSNAPPASDISSCNSIYSFAATVTKGENPDDSDVVVCDVDDDDDDEEEKLRLDVKGSTQETDVAEPQRDAYENAPPSHELQITKDFFHHSGLGKDFLIRPDCIAFLSGLHYYSKNTHYCPSELHAICDVSENELVDIFQFLVLFIMFIVLFFKLLFLIL